MIVRFLFTLALLAGPAGAQDAEPRLLIREYQNVEPITLLDDFTADEQLVAVPYSVAGFPRIAVHVRPRDGMWSNRAGLVFDTSVYSPDGVLLSDGFYGPLYLIDLNGDGEREILYPRSWEHGALWHVYTRVPDQRDWVEVVTFQSAGFAGLPSRDGLRTHGQQAQISGLSVAGDGSRCWTWRAGVAILAPDVTDGPCWDNDDESNWSGLDQAQAVPLMAIPPEP